MYVASYLDLLLWNNIPIATPESKGDGGVVSYVKRRRFSYRPMSARFQDSSFRTSQGQEEYDSLQKPYWQDLFLETSCWRQKTHFSSWVKESIKALTLRALFVFPFSYYVFYSSMYASRLFIIPRDSFAVFGYLITEHTLVRISIQCGSTYTPQIPQYWP